MSAASNAKGFSTNGSCPASSIGFRDHPYAALARSAYRNGITRSWRPQIMTLLVMIGFGTASGIAIQGIEQNDAVGRGI